MWIMLLLIYDTQTMKRLGGLALVLELIIFQPFNCLIVLIVVVVLCERRYKWWFRNVDLRWFVGIASAIVAVLSLIPLILVFRINQKWGISDLAFSLGDEALVGEWATSKGVLWCNIERCCWLLVGCWLAVVCWLVGWLIVGGWFVRGKSKVINH
jgi:hypothetical protein